MIPPLQRVVLRMGMGTHGRHTTTDAQGQERTSSKQHIQSPMPNDSETRSLAQKASGGAS